MREDLSGQRFGRLVALSYLETREKPSGQKYAVWKCKCDCGNTANIRAASLKGGNTCSCGCYHHERLKGDRVTHGASRTKLYGVWSAMKTRCENPNSEKYLYYGDRGIKVCDEWRDFAAFQKWALESGYKQLLTIDRINVDGNYEPSNCRWATQKEQQNNRRNNKKIQEVHK